MSKDKKNKATKAKTLPTPPTMSEKVKVMVQTSTSVNTESEKFFAKLNEHTPSNGLSPDGYVNLATLIQKRYVDNPDAKSQYSAVFLSGMNSIVDTIIVGTVISEVVNTKSSQALLIQKASYPQLVQIAEGYGIKLPAVDKLALPSKKDLDKAGIVEKNDQLEIPFDEKNIPADVKKKVEKEHKAALKTVELDAKKVTADQLKDSLMSILANRANIEPIQNIVAAVKFLKDFRYNEVNKLEVEKKEEAKAVLDSRSIADWLTDVTTIAEPTLLLTQIGSKQVEMIVSEKCPLGAFLGTRSALSKKGVCPFSDYEVASIVKMMVEWYCTYQNTHVAEESKKKLTQTAKAELEIITKKCEEALKYLKEFDSDIVIKVETALNTETSDALSKKLYYFTRSQYFAKDIIGVAKPEDIFVNLVSNVVNKVGIIANLFLSQSNQILSYGEEKATDLVKVKVSEPSKSEKTDTETPGDKSTGNETSDTIEKSVAKDEKKNSSRTN